MKARIVFGGCANWGIRGQKGQLQLLSISFPVSNIYSKSNFRAVSSLNGVSLLVPTVQGLTSAVLSSCTLQSILLKHGCIGHNFFFFNVSIPFSIWVESPYNNVSRHLWPLNDVDLRTQVKVIGVLLFIPYLAHGCTTMRRCKVHWVWRNKSVCWSVCADLCQRRTFLVLQPRDTIFGTFFVWDMTFLSFDVVFQIQYAGELPEDYIASLNCKWPWPLNFS